MLPREIRVRTDLAPKLLRSDVWFLTKDKPGSIEPVRSTGGFSFTGRRSWHYESRLLVVWSKIFREPTDITSRLPAKITPSCVRNLSCLFWLVAHAVN